MRTRSFLVLGLVVALLIAGSASYYASTHPDGLEYVAKQVGFADTADEHAGAGGPLADYRVVGVENERLSGGLAGVAGALVVLLLTGGLGYALRRRPRTAAAKPAAAERAPAEPAEAGHAELDRQG